tara:strand:- start:139 stop:603 length:465 start_codon:yes stop_codon:yes gene_type:complete
MVKQYELLESKVKDQYIREALRRIRVALQDLDVRADSTSTSGDVTNIVNALSVWKKINTNANASSTTIVDQISITDFSTLEYTISIEDTVNNKTRSMKMMINNQNGSLKENVFGKIGGGIDFSISSVNNLGTMELTITNNEANGLAVNMARLTL